MTDSSDASGMDLATLISHAYGSVNLSVPSTGVPEVPEGLESLEGKDILLVDDSTDVFAAFIPPLVAATGGSARFLRHTDETQEELVGLVMGFQPAVVLLDGELGNGVLGMAVARELKEKGSDARCIGFSSSRGTREEFLQAGAESFVLKSAHDPWGTLREVAGIL
ncbi:MAG: hypothetical protein WCV62_05530 [Candidatus Peribacteraceae bacterium]|jgi:CheY-like chemotaxis protein